MPIYAKAKTTDAETAQMVTKATRNQALPSPNAPRKATAIAHRRGAIAHRRLTHPATGATDATASRASAIELSTRPKATAPEKTSTKTTAVKAMASGAMERLNAVVLAYFQTVSLDRLFLRERTFLTELQRIVQVALEERECDFLEAEKVRAQVESLSSAASPTATDCTDEASVELTSPARQLVAFVDYVPSLPFFDDLSDDPELAGVFSPMSNDAQERFLAFRAGRTPRMTNLTVKSPGDHQPRLRDTPCLLLSELKANSASMVLSQRKPVAFVDYVPSLPLFDGLRNDPELAKLFSPMSKDGAQRFLQVRAAASAVNAEQVETNRILSTQTAFGSGSAPLEPHKPIACVGYLPSLTSFDDLRDGPELTRVLARMSLQAAEHVAENRDVISKSNRFHNVPNSSRRLQADADEEKRKPIAYIDFIPPHPLFEGLKDDSELAELFTPMSSAGRERFLDMRAALAAMKHR